MGDGSMLLSIFSNNQKLESRQKSRLENRLNSRKKHKHFATIQLQKHQH